MVWQDDRFGSGLGEIYARVLDGSGNFISEQIRITDDSDASMHPEVVWAATHFAIGYMGEAAGVLHIATLSTQGEPLSDLAVQGASGSLRDMLAVSDGIALASLGPGAATFQLVDANGTATANASDVGDAESASEAGPSIARTSNGYAIFWDDIRTANHDLRFGAVSSSGQKLGADQVLVDDAAVSRFVRSVSHAGALAMVWQDDPDITRAAAISEKGTLLGAPTLISELSQGAPAIASDGARLALLYATSAGPELALRTSDLAPLQTMTLAAEPGVYSVDVVATDDGFAAAWSAKSSVSVALGCAPSRE